MFLVLCEHQAVFSLIVSDGSSLGLVCVVVSSHACIARSVEDLRKTFYTSPGFSFWVAFSSLVVCSMTSSHLGLLKLFSVSSMQGLLMAFASLSSLFLCHGLITIKAVSWSSDKVHLICFLSLRDVWPSLPDVQWLENHCLKYFVFVVAGLIVNPVACLFWLKQANNDI